ncbi:MAG: carboxypeptidase regulatory-like domain-containing protein, partial [Opitutaceae bacterium]
MTCPTKPLPRFLRHVSSVLVYTCCSIVLGSVSVYSADDARRNFDIPQGNATETLRQFAQQSGREIIFSADMVQGVTTKAVRGQHRVSDALRRMLEGTNLTALQDERTQAVAIHRKRVAAADPAAPPVMVAAAASAATSANPAVADAIVTVRGRVRNGATGAFLEGALVEVPGASRSAVTERDGRFALDHLPGGPVVLVVSYTGLETERIAVTPSEAHSLDVVLGSNLVRLEKYVVSELREGNA